MLESFASIGFLYTNNSTFLKIRNVKFFSKHPFGVSCLALASFFLSTYLVIFAFHSFFPDPGIRTNGYDPASLVVISRANDGNGLSNDWEKLGADVTYKDGSIEVASGSGLLSPLSRRRGTKYVSLSIASNVDPSSLSLKAYDSIDDALLGETPIQEAIPYFVKGAEGFTYEFRFSYDHGEIAAVSLEYNETGSIAALSIKQFTFAYFA